MPIRHVAFLHAAEGAFPIDELAGSPLLRRLDSIGLAGLGLTDAEVARFVVSDHVTRCAWMDLTANPLGLPAFAARRCDDRAHRQRRAVNAPASIDFAGSRNRATTRPRT